MQLNRTKYSWRPIAIGYMDMLTTIGGIALMHKELEMETISVGMNHFNDHVRD